MREQTTRIFPVVLCDRCQGSGKSLRGTLACPDCSGRGFHRVSEVPPENAWSQWFAHPWLLLAAILAILLALTPAEEWPW